MDRERGFAETMAAEAPSIQIVASQESGIKTLADLKGRNLSFGSQSSTSGHLMPRNFLLEERPRFVDFDLFGMLGNFLYSGHYDLPKPHKCLRAWFNRVATIKLKQ